MLVGRDFFGTEFKKNTLNREESLVSLVACVHKEATTRLRKTAKKCIPVHCQKCNVGLCTGQGFQVYHTKVD
jgi:hypothetical protein